MDYVKALEILKELAESTRRLSERIGDLLPTLGESLEAYEVAIDAVGKQIPKPAEVRKRDGYIIPLYHCPDCGEQIGDVWRYQRCGRSCPNCGQRLSF